MIPLESIHPSSSKNTGGFNLRGSGTAHYHQQDGNDRLSESCSHPKQKQQQPFNQMTDILLGCFNSTVDIKSVDFNQLFDQLEAIVNAEFPQNRRSDGLEILQNARVIYLHLRFLKNKCKPEERLNQQIEGVLEALQKTTKFSHDQFYGQVRALENRKLQISLGLVEALAELFVLDIDTFGLQLTAYEKCSKLRRSIGNALMNLVYQQREAKHRLCSNSRFLRRVADVIGQVHPLVQFYAGLIQNVSYNADRSIAVNLSITVNPLVRTAISIAYGGEEEFDLSNMPLQKKQHLLKILSALWNLAEDPIENKQVMCNEVPQFVPLLLKIMFSDQQRELQFIQAATGILKHLCAFILQFGDLFARIYRKGLLVVAFVRQLASSSPDLVTDSLTALSILSRHPVVAKDLLTQDSYIQQVSYLVRSTNEGISRASRVLLDTIYSSSINFQMIQAIPPQSSEMCASLACWSTAKTVTAESAQKYQNHQATQQQQQFFTLPRTIQQTKTHHNQMQQKKAAIDDNGLFIQQQQQQNTTPKGVLKQQNQPTFQQQFKQKNVLKSGNEEEENPFIEDPSLEFSGPGQDLPTSVQCTREVSPQSCSFNDEDKNQEWPSIQSTSVRSSSGAQSRASASELPDSPSQCASHKAFQLKEIEIQILKALDENKQSGECTNANVSGDVDAPVAEEKIESESRDELEQEKLEQISSGNLLAEVIRNCMPKPGFSPNPGLFPIPMPAHFNFATAQQQHQQSTTPLLTPVSSNSPCKSPMPRHNNGEERRKKKRNGGLLEESIAAVMPIQQNQLAFGVSPRTRKFSSSRNTSGSEVSPNMLRPHNNSEDDDFQFAEGNPHQQQQFPMDVAREIGAQWITLDCQKIPTNLKGQKSSPRPNSKASNASGSSHIPIPVPIPLQSSTIGASSAEQKGNGSKLKTSHGQKTMVSPRKLNRKPPAPPLAPKPTRLPPPPKQKESSRNATTTAATMERGQTKVVSL